MRGMLVVCVCRIKSADVPSVLNTKVLLATKRRQQIWLVLTAAAFA